MMDASTSSALSTIAAALGTQVFLKATLVVAVAWAAARILRGSSAARRHAVWTSAFAALLALPILTAALPSWNVGVVELRESTRRANVDRLYGLDVPRNRSIFPMKTEDPKAADRAQPTEGTGAIGAGNGEERARTGLQDRSASAIVGRDAIRRSAGATEVDGGPRRAIGAVLLLGLWLAGALTLLGRLAMHAVRVRNLTADARPADRSLRRLARTLADSLGIRRPVRVLLSPGIRLPALWGTRSPVILLPEAARDWDAARRRAVLLHELAHIRRRDYVLHLIVEIGCVLHWPNPLVWLAARRARLEQEAACDDAVLLQGLESHEYATHLLDLARALTREDPGVGAALAMAQPSTLKDRIRAVLQPSRDRRGLTRRILLYVGLAVTLLTLPVAILRPWADPADAEARALVTALDSDDATTRELAAWSAAKPGASRKATPVLIQRLEDPDPRVRGVIAWSLGEVGDHRAIEPLIRALGDEDAYVREMAVLGLSRFDDDPRVVPALVSMTTDETAGVRSVLTDALGRVGTEAAADALARIARQDPDAHARSMAIGNLVEAGSPLAGAALLQALQDPDPGVRRNAAWALGLVRTHPPGVVEALVTLLQSDEDEEVRGVAISALRELGDPAAVDALVHALESEDWSIRSRAVYALGFFDHPAVIEGLLGALRDPKHQVRLSAVHALERIRRR